MAAVTGRPQRPGAAEWPELDTDGHVPEWALATIHPSAVLRSDDRDEAFDGLVKDLTVARVALVS